MNILVKMTADSPDEKGLREMFTNIDIESTGYISAQELRIALSKAGIKYDEIELDQIVAEVDYHGNNRINYSEFLAATLSVKKILTNERLVAMFRQFDMDNSGFITHDDIIEAMQKLGHKITGEEIKDIMKKHAVAKEGQISFDEFKLIFQNLQ